MLSDDGTLVYDRNNQLTVVHESGRGELYAESALIRRFCQARTENSMNLYAAANDAMRKRVMFVHQKNLGVSVPRCVVDT